MKEQFNVNLYLTNFEREELLKLHDTLFEVDYDTLEQVQQAETWLKVISRLVFGKVLPEGDHIYPLSLRNKNESTD